METWDALRSRRNVRSYLDKPIDPAELDRILDAGRRAPSAFNSQPWDFIVATGAAQLADLATVWRGASHVARSAATIAVATPVQPDADRSAWAQFDLGQAVMAMAITAADLGIGSAHAIIEDQERFRSLFGVPDTHRGAYLLALGHPADGPLRPLDRLDRRSLDDVVHRSRW
ncbi:MAG: nitroreductase family protein [Acidimicrobiales bacterium]